MTSKRLFPYLARAFLFWIAFFLVQRVLFLAYEFPALQGVEPRAVVLAFWHGLRFDASAACYILMAPFILLAAGKGGALRFNGLLVVLSSLINAGDMGLYDAWGTKLSVKALYYLAYPKEIAASVSTGTSLILVALIALQIVGGLFFLERWVGRGEERLGTAVSGLLCLGLLVVGARGGLGKLPLTKADSYFSTQALANSASVNGLWNLVSDASRPKETKNPYRFFPPEQARAEVEKLYREQGRPVKVLTTDRPNIAIFMLESWSADVIGPLGGEPDVTPAFNRLAQDGLLFTNVYANGFRTEHGLASIFSAVPSHPKSSIIRNFGKFERLPSLIRVLDARGYDPAAYYGAELSFANTGSYFHTAGFKRIVGEGDFPYQGKTTWGVYDEDLLAYQVEQLETQREPFAALTLTITSHEPFDAPGPVAFPGNSYAQKYRNSVHYTDGCLGRYFERARKKPWFKNTLFVLVADHAHIYPKMRAYNEPARYHIPMLFYGDVIRKEFRGKRIAKFGSQTDIAATILGQLGVENKDFRWSKDLLNERSPSFSFYTFDDGFGWVDDSGSLIYDHAAGKSSGPDEKALKPGKAYLEALFEEYLNY